MMKRSLAPLMQSCSSSWATRATNSQCMRSPPANRSVALLAAAGLAGVAGWCFQLQAHASAVDQSKEADTERLPVHKLACRRDARPPRTPCVLVSCGSFNPPTNMHMRMFELARQALTQRGFDVWGGYMSPVGDAYGKPGLAPAYDRVTMCEGAAAGLNWVMVDSWEAHRPGYTRTLEVLQRVRRELQQYVQKHEQGTAATSSAASKVEAVPTSSAGSSGESTSHSQSPQQLEQQRQDEEQACSQSGQRQQQQTVRVMLVCGADMLATMEKPGVWTNADKVLSDYGVVCVARQGTDIDALLNQPGSLLAQHRDNVVVVVDPVPNAISSTKVREELRHGRTVKYLIPDATLDHIMQTGLYVEPPSST